jgi:hypothetical protein
MSVSFNTDSGLQNQGSQPGFDAHLALASQNILRGFLKGEAGVNAQSKEAAKDISLGWVEDGFEIPSVQLTAFNPQRFDKPGFLSYAHHVFNPDKLSTIELLTEIHASLASEADMIINNHGIFSEYIEFHNADVAKLNEALKSVKTPNILERINSFYIQGNYFGEDGPVIRLMQDVKETYDKIFPISQGLKARVEEMQNKIDGK